VVNQQETTGQPTMGGSVSIAKGSLPEGYNYATLIGWVTPTTTAGSWLATSTVTGAING
jgi:hypothetical protein